MQDIIIQVDVIWRPLESDEVQSCFCCEQAIFGKLWSAALKWPSGDVSENVLDVYLCDACHDPSEIETYNMDENGNII